MAARENQGLQAALIVFVLITIALAVTTYIYFRSSEEAHAAADAAQQQIQQAQAATQGALDENQKLKEMLGFDIAEKLPVIEKRFADDMAQFGADYPDTDPKNYRTLPDYLANAALAKHRTTVEAEKREAQALAEKAATEDRVMKEKQAVEAANQQLVSTYEQERNDFKTERARVTQQMQQIAGSLRTKDLEIAAAKTAGTQAVERFQAQVNDLQNTLESLLNQKREREQTNFDTAHGRITTVSPAERTVLIDLGLADGLQRHTTFSVYDQDTNEYSPQNIKGEIEVTNLLGRHLAEARVLGDDNSNPIVRGDLIYTPAWRPGVFLHFAVAGFIDINGDGVEDRELLRNIIHSNGGVIDTEDDPSKMTVSTRYLIIGERPDETTGETSRAIFTNMYQRSTELGVELMPLPRFLSLMGYRAGASTVQIGGRGDASGQPTQRAPGQPSSRAPGQPATGGAPDVGADPFRARRPPRGEAGAF